ncbi:uncharacterized protein PEZ65_020976 [Lycodopsis pacificus]
MIESNKVVESPYLSLSYSGQVYTRTNMVLVTSCRIRVYKFPFDVQSCNLTFKSYIHTEDEIKLLAYDSKWKIEWSLLKMTQTEWLFTNLTISRETVHNFDTTQTVVVYTISMKRRSALYVANFLVPILFFLCLDLTSFLISDTGGEKLSFKVTVLLAVTVMQLILNEILPSSSDRIPLVVIFCIGIFGLMMLSLLETIVVMRLLEKDSASQANKADEDQSLSEDCGDEVGKANCCTELKNRTPSVCNVSVDETPSEQLSKEDNSSQPTEEFNALEKISGELKEMEKTLTQVLHSTKEEGKPGYWTRVAKIVNIVFFFFYVTAVSVLLSVLFILWNEPEEQIQKDDSPQNPYLSYDRTVTYEEDMKVVSTYKIHKFPFDTQRCSISIGSAIHCIEEIRLLPSSNASRAIKFSRDVIKTQGEWEFLHLTVTRYNFTLDNRMWENLVYNVNNSIQSLESNALLLILEQLKELQNTLNLLLGCRQEGGKSGHWAARINRAFFIFYVTTVSLFLSLIFTAWST